jgi:hypothetical protein
VGSVTWLAHLLDLPLTLVWSGFWLAPSSVTTILFDERSTVWATPRCLGVGDVSHLYAAGLPVQPAGITANVDEQPAPLSRPTVGRPSVEKKGVGRAPRVGSGFPLLTRKGLRW